MKLETYQLVENPPVAVIGLHGWSGTEKSMLPIAKGAHLHSTKWYFPCGPYTAEETDGYTWFSGPDRNKWDSRQSIKLLHELTDRLFADGYQAQCIFLVGFSMGACLALEFALQLPYKLGGIVALAGFIRDNNALSDIATRASVNTPILLLHGRHDTIIHPDNSVAAREYLINRGHDVKMELYSAAHKIPISKIPLIREFIEQSMVIKPS